MRPNRKQIKTIVALACQPDSVDWAVLTGRVSSDWSLVDAHGLKKAEQARIRELLDQAATRKWLGAASAKKSSYRKNTDENLPGDRVYAFPLEETDFLLVGGSQLKSSELRYLSSLLDLATNTPSESGEIGLPPERAQRPSKIGLDLEANLESILETVASLIPCKAAFMAVLAGEEFTVQAGYGLSVSINQASFSSDRFNPAADGQIFSEATEVDIELGDEVGWKQLVSLDLVWLAVPVVIGQRLIALCVFGRPGSYSSQEIQAATAICAHIAPPVERSILGEEAAYYLQRFALLNELSSFASSGMSLAELVARGKTILSRAFATSMAKILLFDPENQQFIDHSGGETIAMSSRGVGLERSVIEMEQVLRIDKDDASKLKGKDYASHLVAPMNFRGKVVGVLSLANEEENFSIQDEKFIPVIASQMASMITSLRLNRETQRRASAMQGINEIVQEIIGLEDVPVIADLTADLMAEKFGFEMVLVMILDDDLDELIAMGVGGSHTADIPHGFRFSKSLGIPKELLATGDSVHLRDVSESAAYIPIPGWEPGSGIWVPLQAGGEVFGVLSVEDREANRLDEDDLAALEAVAGILSSVIVNARQHAQLSESVSQLEAVRETSLDISTNLDLEDLLKRVVNRVRTLLDAHGAELGFVDNEAKAVEVLVSENPWQEYSGYRFDFNSGVTGLIAGTGKGLAVADFNSWSGRRASEFKAPFATVAGVPLMLMGEVIGTLVVQDDRPARAFSQKDIHTLELLAPQLAVFIRNAKLYQELEMRMKAQRLAEERLVRSAKLAAVGEMAAAVAHELNNPLTTVTGFAELILDGMPEESTEREDMSLVLSEAQRARLVVRRLLDFSRQSELLRVDTDLNEVIPMVLQMIHHLAQTESIVVRMELWGEIPIIKVDRNQIQQVLLNLVHNAIQAMPKGGELIVESLLEVRDGESWLGIRVSDTGLGIEDENLEKIFEPFFTTKPSGEGTGLGLSVSYSIISEHGGYIDVDSTPGEGSAFTVWLPAEKSEGEN